MKATRVREMNKYDVEFSVSELENTEHNFAVHFRVTVQGKDLELLSGIHTGFSRLQVVHAAFNQILVPLSKPLYARDYSEEPRSRRQRLADWWDEVSGWFLACPLRRKSNNNFLGGLYASIASTARTEKNERKSVRHSGVQPPRPSSPLPPPPPKR